MGVFLSGPTNPQGSRLSVAAAADRVFGLCLLNDWSARDIQSWEMIPLSPFLSKSFATTISPWIVTADALVPFRVAAMAREADGPKPLPYLWDEADQAMGGFDVELQVEIATEAMRARGDGPGAVIRSNARHLYWSPAQMAAHHASAGCNLSAGDLIGTGTLSGPTRE
jgi:fumarylacetoacetase